MPDASNVARSGAACLRFAADHKAADGHFPGNPIIPGAILLRDIAAAIAEESNRDGGTEGPSRCAHCVSIRSAKFHHPVRPGDTLTMSWRQDTGDEIRFSCSIAGGTGSDASGAGEPKPAVTGTLRLSPS